jgi:ABC-type glycerol-3-phosphate transport system substrate-binding protein
MFMSKKLVTLLLVLVLALVSSLAVAQDDDSLADVDPTGVTITYWHEWDGDQKTGIDEVIRLFEEQNEYGITVEQVELGSSGPIRERMSTGIVSGELPNLVGAAFTGTAQGWFLDGVLVPLDPYYNSEMWGLTDAEIEALNQSILDINRPELAPFNGQLLAWPVGISANVMSVNLEMLEMLREDGAIDFEGAPTTLDEFRAVACAASELVTEDGGDVQGFPIRTSASDMYSFIAAQGGNVYDAEADMYDYTSDEVLDVLTFFQELYEDGCAYVPDGPFVNTADFAFGLNPMAVGSSVGVPFIQGDIEESGSGIENWINTTVPWSEGNRTLQPFLRGVAIIEGTPEQNLATWEFIKFWATSTEAQVAWTEAAQYQPYNTATRDALSEDFLEANPQFTSVFEALNDEDITIYSPLAYPGSNDVDSVFEELIVDITTGGTDVETAAAEAQAEANELYQEALENLEDFQ